MQVARLLEPREHRSLGAKLRQIARALELEHALSKDEILSLYLTLAPYGGNLEGIRAASLAYFGKEPRKLTLAEAALLVALPQSPELRRPDRYPQAARAARDRVLDRVAAAGVVPRDEIARAEVARRAARAQAVADAGAACRRPGRRRRARPPHPPAHHRRRLAEDACRIWRASARARSGPKISVAILAVDNETGEVRARVGSADYFDERRAGQVDMTQALRSPGSTLKPFIYGLAFEDGLLHPETLIDDRPVRYGSYTPENFDLTFQGTVTVRRALQMSLNVPAIAVLGKVGVSRLSARLDADRRGAGAAEGRSARPCHGARRRRRQTVGSDDALCRAGAHGLGGAADRAGRRDRAKPAPAARSGRRLVCRQHPDRRAAAGERDARAHRLQDRHLLRLSRRLGGRLRRPHDHRRLGRAAGRRAGAGAGRARRRRRRFCSMPLRAAAMRRRRWRTRPRASSSPPTTRLPPPLQHFSADGDASAAAEPPRIMFPPDGARLELAKGASPEPVALKITGGAAPLTVMVNGVPLPRARRPPHRVLRAGRAGFRAAHRHGRPRRRPTASASACNNPHAVHRMTGLGLGPIVAHAMRGISQKTGPMSTATHDARQGAPPARGLSAVLDYAGASHRRAPRLAGRLCADRVPARLLPDSAGRPRRGALRAGHQADAGDRAIRRHPFPGRGPLQEAGRHLLAAGVGGESGRGGRHPAGAHHHLALPAAVAVRRHRRGAADLLDRARLCRRAAPRCWRR